MAHKGTYYTSVLVLRQFPEMGRHRLMAGHPPSAIAQLRTVPAHRHVA